MAAFVLKDGFERNDDPTFNWAKWDGSQQDLNTALAYATSKAYHGKYSLQATINAGFTDRACCVYKAITINPVHLRVMNVMFDQIPSGDQRIIVFSDAAYTSALSSFGVINSAGTLKWLIRYHSAGAFVNLIGDAVSLNTFYCVEAAEYRGSGGADGWSRLWIDGVLHLEKTAVTDQRSLDFANLGFVFSDANAGAVSSMWCDDAIISGRYIGCDRPTRYLRGRGGDARLGTKRGKTRYGRLYIK